MGDKFYEKHAWVLFFVIGMLFLVSAVPHALGINTDSKTAESIAGVTLDELKSSNPSFFDLYDFYFRFGGLSDLGFAFLITIISLTAFRKGEKWAWYSLWILPAFFIGGILIVLSIEKANSLLIPLALFTILSLLGLLLPYRKFFPKKR
jgi:hypothetical protein